MNSPPWHRDSLIMTPRWLAHSHDPPNPMSCCASRRVPTFPGPPPFHHHWMYRIRKAVCTLECWSRRILRIGNREHRSRVRIRSPQARSRAELLGLLPISQERLPFFERLKEGMRRHLLQNHLQTQQSYSSPIRGANGSPDHFAHHPPCNCMPGLVFEVRREMPGNQRPAVLPACSRKPSNYDPATVLPVRRN
jgi:hypothetical protein